MKTIALTAALIAILPSVAVADPLVIQMDRNQPPQKQTNAGLKGTVKKTTIKPGDSSLVGKDAAGEAARRLRRPNLDSSSFVLPANATNNSSGRRIGQCQSVCCTAAGSRSDFAAAACKSVRTGFSINDVCQNYSAVHFAAARSVTTLASRRRQEDNYPRAYVSLSIADAICLGSGADGQYDARQRRRCDNTSGHGRRSRR